jgi:hypothetical protein
MNARVMPNAPVMLSLSKHAPQSPPLFHDRGAPFDKLRVTLGTLRVTLGTLTVTLGTLAVTLGTPTVTLGTVT